MNGPAQLKIESIPFGPPGWWVHVPTEEGSTCVVEIIRERDYFTIRVSNALLDQSPEAITAAIQMALLALASGRREGWS